MDFNQLFEDSCYYIVIAIISNDKMILVSLAVSLCTVFDGLILYQQLLLSHILISGLHIKMLGREIMKSYKLVSF